MSGILRKAVWKGEKDRQRKKLSGERDRDRQTDRKSE